VRDAIKQKDVKTTKSGGTLEGPAVSFGYEKTSSAAATAGTDTAYHADSPEIVIPGLTMLQSPIISRRGRLEKTGHRISGACTFYAPSLDYIKALDNFKDTKAFAELESYDKLYDMERIIHNLANMSWTGTGDHTFTTPTFADSTTGYEIDRVRFRIRSSAPAGEHEIDGINISGNIGGSAAQLSWGSVGARGSPLDSNWTVVDFPLRVEDDDITSVYKDGVRIEYVANQENVTLFDLDKLYGDATNELTSVGIIVGENNVSGSFTIEVENIYLYKEAEWRIESIKDYRDEYMQIAAVRVRGDRASRRRAYG